MQVITAAELVLVAIERADLAESTKDQYRKAMLAYLDTGASLTDADALAVYAAEQSTSTRAFLKAAVGKWADHVATQVKGMATPDNVDEVQATLYRFEALQEAIQVKISKGTKAHTWLSPSEVIKMMRLPGNGIYGRRDKVALGLLVGAGRKRWR